VTIGYGKIL
jgi:hypothetical protein